jgi:hypothetical protein
VAMGDDNLDPLHVDHHRGRPPASRVYPVRLRFCGVQLHRGARHRALEVEHCLCPPSVGAPKSACGVSGV